MFIPNGYFTFRQAALLLHDADDEWASDDPKGERLGGALASGELVAHGIVIDAEYNGEIRELGEVRQLRPESWRLPSSREAVLGKSPTGRLHQDGFVLTPIIQQTALFAWREEERAQLSPPARVSPGVPGLSFGVHALPAGYIAFDEITRVARLWAKDGLIDADLLDLLNPPDTDAMTQVLATGRLPAYGIKKRTGQVVSLSPATWRMEVAGCPQSIWAIGGHEVLADADGETCLPVLARADLARALQASTVPPDPEERPEGWKPATAITRLPASASGGDQVGAWMLGYAEGFKVHARLLKRDEAIKAATEKLGCTTRQAEAAFQALPYPELRNPPRIAAA